MDKAIIIYIGIVLFIVGVWQTFRRVAHSKVISGILLIFISGMILVFIGNRQLGLFFVYLFTSWFLLIQLFKLSTYYKYFSHIMPFIIGYAVLVALLLKYFNFQEFFWLYLALSSLFLIINLRKQLASKDAIDMFTQIQDNVLKSMPESKIKQKVKKELSPDRSMLNHLISGVVVFIIGFVLSFYLFNGSI